MASVDLEFAIAHPIFNNRFNILKRFEGTAKDSVAIADKSMRLTQIPLGGSEYMDGILGHNVANSTDIHRAGKISKVVLGPSTVSTASQRVRAIESLVASSGGAVDGVLAALVRGVGGGLFDVTISGRYTGVQRAGDISAFASGGSGITLVTTSAPHNLVNGETVTHTNTTLHIGDWVVSNVTSTSYEIPNTFISNDAPANWEIAQEQYTIEVAEPGIGNINSFTVFSGSHMWVNVNRTHNISIGAFVTITGTTNYNGTYEVEGSGATQFKILHSDQGTETGSYTPVVQKFKWKKDSEAYSADVTMTGAPQSLEKGVSVTWATTEGHTTTNTFTSNVTPGDFNLITFETGTKYAYNSGDPITIVGQSAPEGWVAGQPNNPLNVWPFGSVINTDGYNDMYLLTGHGLPVVSGGSGGTFCTIPIGPLLPSHYYRLQITYRSPGTTGSGVCEIFENGTFLTGSQLSLSASTTWNTISLLVKSSADQSAAGAAILLGYFQSTALSKLEVSSISLSHLGSASEYESWSTDYNLAGMVTLSTAPDLGSIRVQRKSMSDAIERGFVRRTTSAVTTDMILPVTVYSVTYTLTNASEDDLRKVQHLMEWQDKGYLLNHFPKVKGLPHCITGRFKLNTSFRRSIFDLSSTAFTLTFEEVVIL